MKTALIVLLVMVVLCLLIGSIRVGGTVEYSEAGFLALLRIGPVKVKLFPRPPKDKNSTKKKKPKKKKSKKKPDQKPEEKKPTEQKQEPKKKESVLAKRGGQIRMLMDYLPLIPEALGDVKRKLLVEELYLDYTLSGRADPAHTAILYGQLSAGGGVVTAALENLFRIKKRRISVNIDFLAEKALVFMRLTLSFTIGQLLSMGVHLGWHALCIYLAQRKQKKQKKQAENAEIAQNTQQTGGNSDGKEASGQ